MKKWILLTALAVAVCFLCTPVEAAKHSIKTLRGLEADFDPLIDELGRYLQQGRFKAIERYVDDLTKRGARAPSGVPLLELVYSELGKNRESGVYLDKWCETSVHHSAFITRGMYHVEEAWRVRGGDWGYTVSNEHSDLFQQKLQQAAADFVTAHTVNEKDPNSATGMLRVCIGSGCSKKEKEEWFEAAISADPTTYFPYFYKYEYLAHKWGGDFQEQTAFVRDCYENTPAGGITYTLMLDYLRAYARRSGNMKRFYSRLEVWPVIEDVLTRWETEYPGALSQYRWRAHFQEELGNYQQALAYLNQALAKYPNSVRELKSRGDIYLYRLKEMAKAKKDYARAVELDPSDDEALCSLGIVYQWHGGFHEKAIEYYDRAIALNPREKWYFYYRGDANMMLENYQDAIESLNQAIRINPRMKKAFYRRGTAYYAMAQYQQAINDFNTAISIDPRFGKALYKRGLSYAYLGDMEMAKNDFRAVMEYEPTYAQSAQRHIREIESGKKVWKRAGRPPKPKKTTTVTLQPQNKTVAGVSPQLSEAESAMFEGLKQYRQGMHKYAKPAFEKVLEIEPQNKVALYHLGMIAYRIDRDYPKALDYCNKAIESDPGQADYYALRGDVFYGVKQYESARVEYENALSIDGKDTKVLKKLAKIYSSKLRDFEKAFDCYDKLVQLEPGNTKFLHKRSMCKYWQKDYRAAIDQFDRLLEVDPKNCGAFSWKGYSYRKLGDKQNMIDQYQKAMQVCEKPPIAIKREMETLQAE